MLLWRSGRCLFLVGSRPCADGLNAIVAAIDHSLTFSNRRQLYLGSRRERMDAALDELLLKRCEGVWS